MKNSGQVQEVELSVVEEQPQDKQAIGRDLELVKHLEVVLDAKLGQAKLKVEALYDLKVGEIVSLDESVDAPIKLMLNDTVIGEGMLVAKDGVFGVQLTSVSTITD